MCGADPETPEAWNADGGSSPRVRSRRLSANDCSASMGIISACAEQTGTPRLMTCADWDHLRVCGADTIPMHDTYDNVGSSPRVRSRRIRHIPHHGRRGIISACAEQTIAGRNCRRVRGDHLRVCGADMGAEPMKKPSEGSSPRVRSRRGVVRAHNVPGGIISACAEQTPTPTPNRPNARDHLRVCGADPGLPATPLTRSGSSPRVRSRRFEEGLAEPGAGIISACAEQTSVSSVCSAGCWDHLRVCGADDNQSVRQASNQGSSPRVRSRQIPPPAMTMPTGIISACAEQTSYQVCFSRTLGDHLRVCGADSCILLWFGLVGCRGIFDSCTARGRKTTWMPIFGIDALGSRMFLCEISEPSPCAEFWLRLHCVHVR